MKIRNLAFVAVAGFSLQGCATVLNGTSMDLDYMSDPEGATVEILGGQTCTTPCTFSRKRGDDQRVDFNLEGYKPEYVYVQSRLGGSTFGNIIAGGGIGAVVDGTNGASNVLYPRPVYIRLVPIGSDDEAVLLDKDGEVISTVAEHNEKVGEDVLEGLEGQGLIERSNDEAAETAETAETAEEADVADEEMSESVEETGDTETAAE